MYVDSASCSLSLFKLCDLMGPPDRVTWALATGTPLSVCVTMPSITPTAPVCAGCAIMTAPMMAERGGVTITTRKRGNDLLIIGSTSGGPVSIGDKTSSQHRV